MKAHSLREWAFLIGGIEITQQYNSQKESCINRA